LVICSYILHNHTNFVHTVVLLWSFGFHFHHRSCLSNYSIIFQSDIPSIHIKCSMLGDPYVTSAFLDSSCFSDLYPLYHCPSIMNRQQPYPAPIQQQHAPIGPQKRIAPYRIGPTGQKEMLLKAVRGRSTSSDVCSTSSDVSSDISPSPLYIPPHRRQPKTECTRGSDTGVR